MKKSFYIILPVVGVFAFLLMLKQKQLGPQKSAASPQATPRIPDQSPPSGSATDPQPKIVASVLPPLDKETQSWLDQRSAGLIIDQHFDPLVFANQGTVTAGKLTIDLGETPATYRHQIQTSHWPAMLGYDGDRKTRRICMTSLVVEAGSLRMKAPLSVEYPQWIWGNYGIKTSGGFVFLKDEHPVTRVGVIIPQVEVPTDTGPGTVDRPEWRIVIRVNDRYYINPKTTAKPLTLGPEVVVLMATKPDKMAASTSVVWFKMEQDGTCSLLTE